MVQENHEIVSKKLIKFFNKNIWTKLSGLTIALTDLRIDNIHITYMSIFVKAEGTTKNTLSISLDHRNIWKHDHTELISETGFYQLKADFHSALGIDNISIFVKSKTINLSSTILKSGAYNNKVNTHSNNNNNGDSATMGNGTATLSHNHPLFSNHDTNTKNVDDSTDDSDDDTTLNENSYEDKLNLLHFQLKPFFNRIKHIEVSVHGLSVKGLDFVPENNKNTRRKFSRFPTCLNASIYITSFYFTFHKLDNSAFTNAWFKKNNKAPLKYSCNFNGILVDLHDHFHNSVETIVDLPGLTIIGETDIFLLNSFRDEYFKIIAHLSSPSLSLNLLQLSHISSYFRNLSIYKKFSKCKYKNEDINKINLTVNDFFKCCLLNIHLKFTVEDTILVLSDYDNAFVASVDTFVLTITGEVARDIINKYNMELNMDMSEYLVKCFENSLEAEGIDIWKYDHFQGVIKSVFSPNNILTLCDVVVGNVSLDLTELKVLYVISRFLHEFETGCISFENLMFKELYKEISVLLNKGLKVEDKKCVIETTKEHILNVVNTILPRFIDKVQITCESFSLRNSCRSIFLTKQQFCDLSLTDDTPKSMKFKLNGVSVLLQPTIHKCGDSAIVTKGDNSDAKFIVEIDDVLLASETESSKHVDVEDLSLVRKLVFKITQPTVEKFTFIIGYSDLDLNFSIKGFFLYASSLYTARLTFSELNTYKLEPICKEKLELLRLMKLRPASESSKVNKQLLADLIDIQFLTLNTKIKFTLVNKIPILINIFDMYMHVQNLKDVKVVAPYLRLSIQDPQHRYKWARVLTVSDGLGLFNIDKLKKQTKCTFEELQDDDFSLILDSTLMRISLPHGFEMYQVLDNLITTLKCFVQVVHCFKLGQGKEVIKPKIMKAKPIPKINIKSKRFLFTLDDDPFEAKMNMVFQLGLQEQKRRLYLYKKLEEYSNSEDKIQHSFIESCSDIGALERLGKFMSKSWLGRVQKFKYLEKKVFNRNYEFLWGEKELKIPPIYNKDFIQLNCFPFLMTLIMKDTNISLSQPSFGIDNLPDFIYNVGQGVPKNTLYSILIPFYLNAKFSEIRGHLKDYPLLFLHFPKLDCSQYSKGEKKYSAVIKGDMVISESMVTELYELRKLVVELLALKNKSKRELYTLEVVRTLRPAKIYTDLTLTMSSAQKTLATWGGSYSGAFQQVMMAFDNFSKPPVDPSGALGFWDKLRNTFFARITLEWKGAGGLNVCLKGDKNPYKILDDSAGFVIGFERNVSVTCNRETSYKKFATFNAQNVYFAIPNHCAKPLLSWCKDSDDFLFLGNQTQLNFEAATSYTYFLKNNNTSSLLSDIRKLGLEYIEKKAINLTGGVKLNIGLGYERFLNETHTKRTSKFIPHFMIRLWNPKMVKDKLHDSYRGFRADFIHMAIGLESQNENAYNTLQLTPLVFRHFFKWWKSFSGNFPVRTGKLFSAPKNNPKFGAHIATLSYTADVTSLYVSHICRAHFKPVIGELAKNDSEFFGFKAKVSKLAMDLHQRKEVFHEENRGLNTVKKISKLKFSKCSVSTIEIDLKVVHAQFTPSTYIEQTEESKINIDDSVAEWYDKTDYHEVYFENMDSHISNVDIMTLAMVKTFTFKNECPYKDKYQIDYETNNPIEPYENAVSHDCKLKNEHMLPCMSIMSRLGKLNEMKDAILKTEDVNNIEIKKTLAYIDKYVPLLENFLTDIDEVNRRIKCDEYTGKPLHFANVLKFRETDCFNESFHNIYSIVGMKLRWTESLRNIVLQYISLIEIIHFTKYIDMVSLLRKYNKVVDDEKENGSIKSFEESSSIIDNSIDWEGKQNVGLLFEQNLKNIVNRPDINVDDKHVVHFIASQVQLVSESDPEDCMLVSISSIKLKVLDFVKKVLNDDLNKEVFLSRYAAVLFDANVYSFAQQNFLGCEKKLYFSDVEKPDDKNWQPWLSLEMLLNSSGLKQWKLIDKLSFIVRYDKRPEISLYQTKDDICKEVLCTVPKVEITCDSQQYTFLFRIISELLVYVEPRNAAIKKEIDKIVLATNNETAVEMTDVLYAIQEKIRMLTTIESSYTFKNCLLDDREKKCLNDVRSYKYYLIFKMFLLLKILSKTDKTLVDNSHSDSVLLKLTSSEIVLHMSSEKNQKFLDFTILKANFERMASSDGYNSNNVKVGFMSMVNMEKTALFKDLLCPYMETFNPKEPMVYLSWEMARPIGGIKVLKSCVSQFQDFDIKLDSDTLKKLINWVLPADLVNAISNNDDDNDSDNEDQDSHDNDGTSNSNAPAIKLFSDRTITFELEKMEDRSSRTLVVEDLNTDSFKINITYRGKNYERLINVTGFLFTFPSLEIFRKIITIGDLLQALKNILIKAVLKNSVKFLKNKMNVTRKFTSKFNGKNDKLEHYYLENYLDEYNVDNDMKKLSMSRKTTGDRLKKDNPKDATENKKNDPKLKNQGHNVKNNLQDKDYPIQKESSTDRKMISSIGRLNPLAKSSTSNGSDIEKVASNNSSGRSTNSSARNKRKSNKNVNEENYMHKIGKIGSNVGFGSKEGTLSLTNSNVTENSSNTVGLKNSGPLNGKNFTHQDIPTEKVFKIE
ncbi:Fmp27p SCDLUD_000042 [Saccharomycodes ludwigii]|uniref:Fmp27p n=1 Tax=Saccharomycodes ludwigii TaxID=36035 RepID=UPI001E8A3A9B|nr:hypothetical protein SCDLUD_000042 [Saccharomycodes ludwigii]KAH3902465.1 hypothetical protein SCDLUD_000042 [Saccharomycodes ludwigii]